MLRLIYSEEFGVFAEGCASQQRRKECITNFGSCNSLEKKGALDNSNNPSMLPPKAQTNSSGHPETLALFRIAALLSTRNVT